MRKLSVALFLMATFLQVTLGQSASSETTKVQLGKLAQAIKKTSIYTNPTTRSRIYYTVPQFQYLVLGDKTVKGWHQVLMENGAFGYIKQELVVEFDYVVTAEIPKTDVRNYQLASRSRAAAAQKGTQFTGTRYKWGGNDPLRGIDCSGFVKYLYGGIGINLPRTAAEQVKVGQPIHKLEDLQPGDRLYFWDKKRNKVGHTGLYLGNTNFVHSSSSRGGVATDSLTNKKWLDILVAARR